MKGDDLTDEAPPRPATRSESDATEVLEEGATLERPKGAAPASTASGAPGAAREGERFSAGTLVADRYRIVTRLGRGGMGEVFRAEDLKLGQEVALKFLPPELEKDEECLALLFHEVKIARQITHPNVCRVFDLGEAEGVHFLSMEYIDGEDLKSLLRRIGRLPRDKAIELGRQICEGLAAAHEAGILHRDLKPANLMIDGDGRARITDFGLAALSDSVHGTAIRSGTPAYMAPEQYAGREVTVRSDLYSLGLVLYELFTGLRAFEAASMRELSERQRQGPPPDLSSRVAGFDPGLEKGILACLAFDPEERPASATEVAAALAEGHGVAEGARIATLLLCDLVDRGRLIERRGDAAGAELLRKHDRLARDLLERHGGREIEKTDGFLALFERPWQAVAWALDYHRGLAELSRVDGVELSARVGIHLGEVVLRRNPPEDVARGAKPIEVEGLAKPTAALLTSLAGGRQTLMTQAAFDLARRGAVGTAEGVESLRWLAHGSYEFQGAEEPLEVFEVGVEGAAPLAAPPGSEVAKRTAGEETILGWRPAPGLEIPHRPHWIVDEKLGEGGFGEVWLGKQAKTGERRVYKFCYEAERLRSLQREITVFRLLKEELGLRDDIVRIIDWNLDDSPYFIEFVHVEGGSLLEWAESRGGIAEVPIEDRLEIVAQAATALGAAHSVGVLHKDIKPGNVLISDDAGGRPKAVLTDFGLGQVTEQKRLAALGITVLGLTEMDAASGLTSTGGTRLYLAPELLAGQPPTIQADIYALGVMLYQVAVGDLRRPLAQGWQRHVDDELLQEDIASMVEGSPARRPASAAAVAESLRSLGTRRAEREAERRAARAAARAQRRRKVLTTVAAVSTVFLVVVSYLAVQAIRAREDAERRRGQAEQLIDFMLNDLYEGLDKIGRLDLLDGVSRSSQRYFDSLSARDESPEALYKRGITLQNIGDVLLDQGDTEAALGSQRAAVALFEEAAGRDPSNDEWMQGLSLSRTRLGRVLGERGETEAALAAYRGALSQAEELMARDPENRANLLAVAQNQYRIARLQRQIGDMEATFEASSAALEILEKLSASEGTGWREDLLLLDTRMLVAAVHRFSNDLAEGLEELRLARRLAERRAAEDPGNAYWPRRLAAIHGEIGTLLSLRGELPAALESQLAAIEAYRALAATDPTRVEWPERLSRRMQIAGWIYTQLGEPRKALDLYEQSREVVGALVERDPERLGWVSQLADSHQILGRLHLDRGDTAAAEEELRRAVELRHQVVAASGDDPDPRNYLAWTLVGLGDVHARRGETRRAREIWSEAVALVEPITAESDVLMYVDTHAQALLRLGRLEESRPLVEGLLARGWDEPEFLELVRESGLEIR